MTGIELYSVTADDNNSAAPNGAPEGMLANTVNNTMRQMMALMKGGTPYTVANVVAVKALDSTLQVTGNLITLAGLVTQAVGGGIFLYDSTSSATADDIDVIEPTDTLGRWLRLGSSFAGLTLSGNLTFTGDDPEIQGGDTNGVMHIWNGASSILGSSVKIYGDTHATQAGDIEILTDATVTAHYDFSTTTWDFKANDIGVDATQKIYLGVDTYLHEASADSLEAVVGGSTMMKLDQDIENIIFGTSAGGSITTGYDNVVQGQSAGAALTDGYHNVLLGRNTLDTSTSAQNSVAIAPYALGGTDVSGHYNIALGYASSYGMTTGAENITIGHDAGSVTTGDYNIALGYKAIGTGVVTGDNNIGIGQNAGEDLTSGGGNILAGWNSGANGTTLNNTVSLGYGAMSAGIVTGATNVAIGYYAGEDLTSGATNVLIGSVAGGNITTGATNIAIGDNAMRLGVVTGSDNIALGRTAGYDLTSGTDNVMLGFQAGGNITTGTHNLAMGWKALGLGVTTGAGNSAFGYESLYKVSSGGDNIGIGYQTGYNLASASYSIMIGFGAMSSGIVTGADNVAIGRLAGQDLTSGASNVFIGPQAGAQATTPTNSVSIGSQAGGGSGVMTGAKNVSIGQIAGRYLTSGATNTCVGAAAGDQLTTASNSLMLGYNADTSSSNIVTLGDANIVTFNCKVALTVTSDGRDKTDIEDSAIGLNFINALQTRKFTWDMRDNYFREDEISWAEATDFEKSRWDMIKDEGGERVPDEEATYTRKVYTEGDGTHKNDDHTYGFISQEVQQVLIDQGHEWADLISNTRTTDTLCLKEGSLLIPAVKAIQEVSTELTDVKAENRELKTQMADVLKRLDAAGL